MRRANLIIAAGLLVALSTVPRAAAADQNASTPTTPYEAYVAVKVALARSGPGLEHYATDPLARGDQVQVLEHRDGWVGIRAPAESFSWVPGKHVRRSEDRTQAEVIADDVRCWVGSNIAEIKKHEHQVALRRGEIVSVVDEKQVGSAEGTSETWVKIRPPSGERRWLRAEEISTTRPAGVKDESAVEKASSTEQASADDRESGWTDRSGTPRRRSAGASTVAPAQRGRPTASPGLLDPEVSELLELPADATFNDALTRLQLALTRLVAQRATPEQLDYLERHATSLVRRGTSAYERGQAALLLESINEFRVLAKRRVQQVELASFAPGADSDAGGKGNSAAAVSGETTGSDASAGEDGKSIGESNEESPFLAEGWLMPVASLKNAAPPFVLMNEDGHPVAFVTPAPGVNLRRYIDKEVGLVGQKSFNVFDQPHVVAHRAVQLERHRDENPRVGSSAPWIRFRKSTAIR